MKISKALLDFSTNGIFEARLYAGGQLVSMITALHVGNMMEMLELVKPEIVEVEARSWHVSIAHAVADQYNRAR